MSASLREWVLGGQPGESMLILLGLPDVEGAAGCTPGMPC